MEGDGRESIEGAKDRGFKGGDGGNREGAGPEGEGGGSNECRLLLWSLPRSDVGGCGGGLDGEGVDGDAACRAVCIMRDMGCEGGDCDICSDC